MKRLATLFFAALFALQSIAGPFSISGSTSATVGAVTYATLIANSPCNAARNTYTALVTDWGANGTSVRCVSAASRWLPSNGQTVVKRMGAAVTGIANTETIATQVQMPIAALQAGDTIMVYASVSKSGVTDNLQVSFRWGTAGTTSDTALTGLSLLTVLGATGQAGGFIGAIRVVSNTSAVKLGNNNAQVSPYGGSVGTAAAAATTTGLSDASSNAIWLSFGLRSSSTTDTVGVQEVTIIHIAG
jgi:hypothetical protein